MLSCLLNGLALRPHMRGLVVAAERLSSVHVSVDAQSSGVVSAKWAEVLHLQEYSAACGAANHAASSLVRDELIL